MHLIENDATAQDADGPFGGAILFERSNSNVTGCMFVGNVAMVGGAIGSIESSIHVRDSTFLQNGPSNQAGLGGAAALVGVPGDAPLRFERCAFVENLAQDARALYTSGGDVELIDCSFDRNSPDGRAPGHSIALTAGSLLLNRTTVASTYFALVAQSGTRLDVLNSQFIDSTSAIDSYGANPVRIVNSRFVRCRSGLSAVLTSAVFMQNCIFIGIVDGPAIGAYIQSSVEVSNCTATISPAASDVRPGWFMFRGSDAFASLANSVIVGPSAAFFGFNPIRIILRNQGTSIEHQFVNILGADGILGTEDDDLHPVAGARCVDSGANPDWLLPDFFDLDGDGVTDEPTPHDFDGRLRRVDDPLTPDFGSLAPPRIDIGAYELNRPCEQTGDVSADGRVDLDDLSRLLLHFGRSGGALLGQGDLDTDDDVDMTDLAIVLANFGARCF